MIRNPQTANLFSRMQHIRTEMAVGIKLPFIARMRPVGDELS